MISYAVSVCGPVPPDLGRKLVEAHAAALKEIGLRGQLWTMAQSIQQDRDSAPNVLARTVAARLVRESRVQPDGGGKVGGGKEAIGGSRDDNQTS